MNNDSKIEDVPSDDVLSKSGLAATGNGRVLLLACGALAREIIAVQNNHGLGHLDLQCLPAIFHNHPEKIVPAIRESVEKNRDNYERIFVVYADCGTGGLLQTACDELGVEMVQGPHCYSFFEGNQAFEERDEMTAFYLTDFLVRQFDAFIWKPLGMDRHPELRDMYFGNYEKVVYQAQLEDEDLVERAKAIADRMGLAFEYRFTGYGDLEDTLKSL